MYSFILIIAIMLFVFFAHCFKTSGYFALFLLLLFSSFIGGYAFIIFYSFFLISSYFTGKFTSHTSDVSQIVAKTGPRDWVQVFSNGFPSFLALCLYAYTEKYIFIIVFTVAVGQACADTWASDIGILSSKEPISIFTLQPVRRGESGGITFLGTIASLCSATIFAILYNIIFFSTYVNIKYTFIIIIIIECGVFLDSFLGATFQIHYLAESNGVFYLSEISRNSDGSFRKKARGFKFFTNDMVNLVSGLISVFLSWFFCCLVS